MTEGRRAEQELDRLADEQAALRRVATLVARRAGPEQVFRAVAEAVGGLFGPCGLIKFEPDDQVIVMGAQTSPHSVGERLTLDPGYVVDRVKKTGHAARFDTDDPEDPDNPPVVRELGIRSGLASPVVVEGELWGAITVGSFDRPLPAETEQRLAAFTDLLATAVSDAQARADLRRLADEQAALNRLAASGCIAHRTFASP